MARFVRSQDDVSHEGIGGSLSAGLVELDGHGRTGGPGQLRTGRILPELLDRDLAVRIRSELLTPAARRRRNLPIEGIRHRRTPDGHAVDVIGENELAIIRPDLDEPVGRALLKALDDRLRLLGAQRDLRDEGVGPACGIRLEEPRLDRGALRPCHGRTVGVLPQLLDRDLAVGVRSDVAVVARRRRNLAGPGVRDRRSGHRDRVDVVGDGDLTVVRDAGFLHRVGDADQLREAGNPHRRRRRIQSDRLALDLRLRTVLDGVDVDRDRSARGPGDGALVVGPLLLDEEFLRRRGHRDGVRLTLILGLITAAIRITRILTARILREGAIRILHEHPVRRRILHTRMLHIDKHRSIRRDLGPVGAERLDGGAPGRVDHGPEVHTHPLTPISRGIRNRHRQLLTINRSRSRADPRSVILHGVEMIVLSPHRKGRHLIRRRHELQRIHQRILDHDPVSIHRHIRHDVVLKRRIESDKIRMNPLIDVLLQGGLLGLLRVDEARGLAVDDLLTARNELVVRVLRDGDLDLDGFRVVDDSGLGSGHLRDHVGVLALGRVGDRREGDGRALVESVLRRGDEDRRSVRELLLQFEGEEIAVGGDAIRAVGPDEGLRGAQGESRRLRGTGGGLRVGPRLGERRIGEGHRLRELMPRGVGGRRTLLRRRRLLDGEVPQFEEVIVLGPAFSRDLLDEDLEILLGDRVADFQARGEKGLLARRVLNGGGQFEAELPIAEGDDAHSRAVCRGGALARGIGGAVGQPVDAQITRVAVGGFGREGHVDLRGGVRARGECLLELEGEVLALDVFEFAEDQGAVGADRTAATRGVVVDPHALVRTRAFRAIGEGHRARNRIIPGQRSVVLIDPGLFDVLRDEFAAQADLFEEIDARSLRAVVIDDDARGVEDEGAVGADPHAAARAGDESAHSGVVGRAVEVGVAVRADALRVDGPVVVDRSVVEDERARVLGRIAVDVDGTAHDPRLVAVDVAVVEGHAVGGDTDGAALVQRVVVVQGAAVQGEQAADLSGRTLGVHGSLADALVVRDLTAVHGDALAVNAVDVDRTAEVQALVRVDLRALINGQLRLVDDDRSGVALVGADGGVRQCARGTVVEDDRSSGSAAEVVAPLGEVQRFEGLFRVAEGDDLVLHLVEGDEAVAVGIDRVIDPVLVGHAVVAADFVVRDRAAGHREGGLSARVVDRGDRSGAHRPVVDPGVLDAPRRRDGKRPGREIGEGTAGDVDGAVRVRDEEAALVDAVARVESEFGGGVAVRSQSRHVGGLHELAKLNGGVRARPDLAFEPASAGAVGLVVDVGVAPLPVTKMRVDSRDLIGEVEVDSRGVGGRIVVGVACGDVLIGGIEAECHAGLRVLEGVPLVF